MSSDPVPDQPSGLRVLEASILRAKGLSETQLSALSSAGVRSKADFATIGDAATLASLVPDLDDAVASEVVSWAAGTAVAAGVGGRVVLDTSDAVYCVHCQAKQPKDYSPGDLCVNCGKQAEPTESCYWCGATGPGRYCRRCGATFVPTAELELAVLLRRDGLAKDDIPKRLAAMAPSEKDALWGRVRHTRGG